MDQIELPIDLHNYSKVHCRTNRFKVSARMFSSWSKTGLIGLHRKHFKDGK